MNSFYSFQLIALLSRIAHIEDLVHFLFEIEAAVRASTE